MHAAHWSTNWARSGVRHAVICPGSRSTPLALALAEQTATACLDCCWTSARPAFFALGIAQATHAPVALLCTSGTAAANFMPAVAEADLGRVPLVVLTADRPPELRDDRRAAGDGPDRACMARTPNGSSSWRCPHATDALLRYVRTAAGRAVATARWRRRLARCSSICRCASR